MEDGMLVGNGGYSEKRAMEGEMEKGDAVVGAIDGEK